MTTLMTSIQLNLKDTTDTVRSALYLDLHLEIDSWDNFFRIASIETLLFQSEKCNNFK